jgi:hypothetical protein
VQAHLGASDAGDVAALTRWLATATRQADQYMGHDWTMGAVGDGDDETRTPESLQVLLGAGLADGADIPLPDDVELGVLEWCRIAWEIMGPTARPYGLTSAKTGDLSEGYAVGSRIRGGNLSTRDITSDVNSFWFPYRADYSI